MSNKNKIYINFYKLNFYNNVFLKFHVYYNYNFLLNQILHFKSLFNQNSTIKKITMET